MMWRTGIISRVRRTTLAAVLLLLWLGMSPGLVLADELTPREIVEDVVRLDGMTVTTTGEAIGDRLHADDDHVWVNILGEDGLAIGIYLSNDDADRIGVFGDYSHQGDIVRVDGVVNAACDDHGGDLDIHASSFEIVSTGHEVEHEADPLVAVAGLALIGVAAVLFRVYRRRRLTPGEHR
jgi:hypothetical protein